MVSLDPSQRVVLKLEYDNTHKSPSLVTAHNMGLIHFLIHLKNYAAIRKATGNHCFTSWFSLVLYI